MIPTSANEIVRFPIEGVTYLIAMPTLMSRAAYRRGVSECGAVYHTDKTLLDVMRDGIRETVADDQQGELLEIVSSYEIEFAAMAELGDDAAEAEKESLSELVDKISEIEDFLRSRYDRYNSVVADREYWQQLAPIVAFRHFVKGWEGGEDMPPYKRQGELVCLPLLDHLPRDHVTAVGWKALTLMSPSVGQEKNLEPQSQSATDPATSTAEDTPLTMVQAGT